MRTRSLLSFPLSKSISSPTVFHSWKKGPKTLASPLSSVFEVGAPTVYNAFY